MMSIYVKQETLNQTNSQSGATAQTNVSLILLNQMFQLFLEELEPKHKQETVTTYDEDEDEGSIITQDLQAAILKLQKRGSAVRDAQNASTFNETSGSDEAQTSTGTSTGMQAVFDLQGWICKLLGDAMKAKASESGYEVEMGNAMEETAEDKYEEIQKKIDELKKKQKSSSFWGFIKGLGSLVKDIDKLVKDAAKDLVTGNFGNLGGDVSSIKNNDAITDLVNLSKLVLQVDKMGMDAMKNLMTGNMNGLKSEGKKDFSKIEENPALGLAIELLSYAALAASLVGAGLTGGALSVAVVAVVAAMAMASTLNSALGGAEDFASNLLQTLGIPQSVADAITTIPSFDDLANGAGDLLEKMGVPPNVAKPVGDALSVIAIAAAVGLTGDIGLVFMAAGTAISSDASKFTEDCGVTGTWAEVMTISLQIAGMAMACYGGIKMAGSSEGTQVSESTLQATQKVQIGASFAEGNFEVMQGAKDIDMGSLLSSITKIEGELSLLQALISINSTMLSNTSSQSQNTIAQDDQMINNFGVISEAGIAAAEALAKN